MYEGLQRCWNLHSVSSIACEVSAAYIFLPVSILHSPSTALSTVWYPVGQQIFWINTSRPLTPSANTTTYWRTTLVMRLLQVTLRALLPMSKQLHGTSKHTCKLVSQRSTYLHSLNRSLANQNHLLSLLVMLPLMVLETSGTLSQIIFLVTLRTPTLTQLPSTSTDSTISTLIQILTHLN